MTTINGYIPQVSPLMFETAEGQRAASALIEFGGWHQEAKTLSPIHVSALTRMPSADVLNWVFDCLAAATEAGRLDVDRFIIQLFAGPGDLRDFRVLLRDVGLERWMNERHHSALRNLGFAECDCSSYMGVATLFDPEEMDWA